MYFQGDLNLSIFTLVQRGDSVFEVYQSRCVFDAPFGGGSRKEKNFDMEKSKRGKTVAVDVTKE